MQIDITYLKKIKHVQLSVSRMKHNVKITPEQTVYIYIYILTFSLNCFTMYYSGRVLAQWLY